MKGLWGEEEEDEEELATIPPAAQDVSNSIKPGKTICEFASISVKQAQNSQGTDMSLIALAADASSAQREAFDRIIRYGSYGGLTIERADDSAIVAGTAFAGTLAHIPSLGWRLQKRLEVFSQIAQIVSNLHTEGIAYGTLDPMTILLDEALQPVLLAPELITEPNPYSAPESLDGATFNVPSDIFTLGRLLHFVVGQQTPPVEYESPARLDDLMTYPAGLSRIVRKATLSDPKGRYRTVDQMLEELTRYGRYEEVGIAHPDVEEQNLGGMSMRPAPMQAEVTQKTSRKRLQAAKGDRSSLRVPEIESFRLSGVARISLLLAGIVSLLCALALTYFAGDPAWIRILISACAGLIGFAMWNPGMEREASVRTVFGTLAACFIFVMNPSSVIAEIADRAGLRSADVQERAENFERLKKRGKTKFYNIDFTGADLTGKAFLFTKFDNASFDNANLTGAEFVMAELDGASFNGAIIYATSFQGSSLEGVVDFELAECDEHTGFPEGWYCGEDGHPKEGVAPSKTKKKKKKRRKKKRK